MEMKNRNAFGRLAAALLVAAGILLAVGCTTASSRTPEAMEMSPDVSPSKGAVGTKDQTALSRGVEAYLRSTPGVSVVVLRGGIRGIRIRTSTVLVYEQIGGARSTWLVLVYDARTRSLRMADQETGALNPLLDRVTCNSDGSVELRFGQTAPADKASNWIRTSSDVPW